MSRVLPRSDVLSWEEYFMSVALLSAQRSKDPGRQVGACIVNPDNRIVGIGYNGFPTGCSKAGLPWNPRSAGLGFLDTKHAYVCHAELNAVVNALSISQLKGATLYVTCFPCNECAKLIIQVGITRVVYLDDDKHDSEASQAARDLFAIVGIRYEVLEQQGRTITLTLKNSRGSTL